VYGEHTAFWVITGVIVAVGVALIGGAWVSTW
jgi:hypothetical protein